MTVPLPVTDLTARPAYYDKKPVIVLRFRNAPQPPAPSKGAARPKFDEYIVDGYVGGVNGPDATDPYLWNIPQYQGNQTLLDAPPSAEIYVEILAVWRGGTKNAPIFTESPFVGVWVQDLPSLV